MPAAPLPHPDELGPRISEHLVRSRAGCAFLVLGIFFLLGGTASTGLAVQRWSFAYAHLGPAAVWRHSGTAWAAAVILSLAGALLLFVRPKPLRVAVHQDGLRWRRGRRAFSARWTQVREIRTRATRYRIPALGKRTQAELVLGLRPPGIPASKLHKLRLPHTLSDFEALTTAIKTQVYPLLMAEMQRAIRQGRPLAFGNLHLTPEGIRQGRKTLTWRQLQQVSLENGVLRLGGSPSGASRELRADAHSLPNLEVCLQLIDLLNQQR